MTRMRINNLWSLRLGQYTEILQLSTYQKLITFCSCYQSLRIAHLALPQGFDDVINPLFEMPAIGAEGQIEQFGG